MDTERASSPPAKTDSSPLKQGRESQLAGCTLPEIGDRNLGRGMRHSASAPNLDQPASQGSVDLLKRVKFETGGGDPWWDDFVERHYDHQTTSFRRGMGLLQRDVINNSRTIDDIEFWGNKGVEGFRKYLKHRYGSVVAGWRVLDIDRSGRLSFREFCMACRHMGFSGNLKKLWDEMDTNKSGFLSIMEIDPETGHYLGSFKLALLKHYGDILTAWTKGLDTNGSRRIEEREIADCVKRLNLKLDSKKLFNMLRSGPKDLGVTLDQFDPDAYRRLIFGDTKGITSKSTHDFEDFHGIESGDGLSVPLDVMTKPLKDGALKWRQHLVECDQAERNEALANIRKYTLGVRTLEDLKEALRIRCVSLFGAWKYHLDLDGNGRLTFSEFNLAMNRLGFHGELRSLWAQMDPNGIGSISFASLDPETDAAMSELKGKFVNKYGNLLVAWLRCIDLLGNGCVNEQQFIRACEEVGYNRDPKRLFGLMRPDIGRKFITLKDFDTKAYLSYQRGDYRMITEEDSRASGTKKSKSEMNFYERQGTMFTHRIQVAREKAYRADFAKALNLANAPDHRIDTSEEFVHLCRRKYGTMMAAWRNCLDSDHNGRLTFSEFSHALRRLGYAGDFTKLFKHYDRNGRGCIFFHDLSPKEDELVSCFLQFLAFKYVTIDIAWKTCFKKAILESIDEQDLKRVCIEIGYPHNSSDLFNVLRPKPGQQLLTVWDIDPMCTRKKQRGEVGYLTGQRVPGSPRHASPHGNSKLNLTQSSHLDSTATPPISRLPSSSAFIKSETGASRLSKGRRICEESTYPGVSQLEALRIALRKHYGSTVAAWRTALDPNKRGEVSFGAFCLALSSGHFNGNARTLFKELCTGRTGFHFVDLDAVAQGLLDTCRQKILIRFDSITEAWQRCFDPEGIGHLNEQRFVSVCEQQFQLRPGCKWPKKVFQLLLVRLGQRTLTLSNLEALLIGLPFDQQIEAWAGRATERMEDDEQLKLKAQAAVESALSGIVDEEEDQLKLKAQSVMESALSGGVEEDEDQLKLKAQNAMESALEALEIREKALEDILQADAAHTIERAFAVMFKVAEGNSDLRLSN